MPCHGAYEIGCEKIHTLIKAADVSIDSYWLGLFAKLFKDLIFNVGSGGGAAPVAIAAPVAGGGGVAPVFEEKKPVQYLASKYIKSSLDEPVKGEKKKLKTKLRQDFRHEVKLLVKLRHPNIVQFLGAVTERKPLMLITEYLRGGDLHQYLKEKGSLSPLTVVNFALDIPRLHHHRPADLVLCEIDPNPERPWLAQKMALKMKVRDAH
ncbi:Serine/threonine-protein kinase CTR1 [Acorus calamus]|uniref:Serine/threonine-protein kinase CTR1 n=1 Tax=Acorus calamus TaxID=4465 RepID=A0AAV9E5H8_ACOCL|nr:Serine/threonine-protein kinase CTR1 [Acorus calamus]